MNAKSVEKLEFFFSQFKKLNFKKREMILRAGDEPRGVMYLKKGYVRLYSISKDGEELTLIIYKPDDIFPIVWAINNIPNEYYFEAMTPAEIYRVPREKFLIFLKENPDVLFELTSKILSRFRRVLHRMEYLVFGNAQNKVASILLICTERFGKKEKNKVIIQAPLTHRDIANLVGMTRETASIEIEKLERKGIVGRKGRLLVVKNQRKLEEEALLPIE